MKNFQAKKLIMLYLILSFTVSVCEAQKYERSIKNPEKELFGKSLNTKTVKYREAPSIVRAKKKQAASKKKLKKDFQAYVKSSRKRAVKIQTPEVQSRMLENRKEADMRAKEKRKKINKATRETGKKYR